MNKYMKSKELPQNTQETVPNNEDVLASGEKKDTIKTPEELEKSVWKKIGIALEAQGDFKVRGKEGIKNAIANSGITSETVAEEMEKAEKKLSKLCGIISKKLIIMAVGMSIFASAGLGEFKKAHSAETPEEELTSISLEKLDKMTENELGELSAKLNKLTDARKERLEVKAEKIRNDLIQHVKSIEYLKKLAIEFHGDSGMAKTVQEGEIKNLKKVKINLISWQAFQDLKNKIAKNNNGFDFNDETDGLYDTKLHEVYCSYDESEKKVEEILRHELLHSNKGGGFTKHAEKLFKKAYRKRGDEYDKYYSKPDEMLAGKQDLDREMEELDIKKYGEKFTDKHFEKMMEAYREGKFSDRVNGFIKTIKPEYFKKIFDEVAKNEHKESSEIVQA